MLIAIESHLREEMKGDYNCSLKLAQYDLTICYELLGEDWIMCRTLQYNWNVGQVFNGKGKAGNGMILSMSKVFIKSSEFFETKVNKLGSVVNNMLYKSTRHFSINTQYPWQNNIFHN